MEIQASYTELSKKYQIEIRRLHPEENNCKAFTISGPQDVYNLLRDSEWLDREVFYCMHLNTRNQVLSLEEISKGTLNAAIVHPREVYKAVILRSASGIILAHNHPSGDPAPSRDDLVLTQRLKDAGELIGIPVLDHIIIGHDKYYSLREHDVF